MDREYDDEAELHRYIFNNYPHRLSERECALRHAALLELKARHSSSDSRAASYRGMDGYFLDAEVAAIAESGLGAYDWQCCDRILRDDASDIYINRCEACQRIVVSPVACTCLWCGCQWYERRPEMVARARSSIYPRPGSQFA